MNNVQDVLKQVRSLLSFNAGPGEEDPDKTANTEQAFSEAMLTDGTIVKWEGELSEGTVIIVVTAEGEIPAPDGSHELEDGTVITTEGGVVTAITKSELPAEDPTNEVEIEMSKQIEDLQAANTALSAEIDSLRAEIKTATEKFSKLTEAQAKTLEVVEALAAEPAAEPVKTEKFSKKDKQQERFGKILGTIGELKKK